MAIHNNDEEKVPSRFEVIADNGDTVTLKALWIKTFTNGYIDIGCDLVNGSSKVYGLQINEGKLIVTYGSILPFTVVDGVVYDKDSTDGIAVIDNIKFFTYDEIVRYLQTTRMSNLRLRKEGAKPLIEQTYDTDESLLYVGEYHDGLKNRGAAPGELMCMLAHMYSNINEEELAGDDIINAVIELTKNTSILMQNMIRNKDVENAYFGGDIEVIYDYAISGNAKALNSISNMWVASSYGPVDIQPIFVMYKTLEEQKEEETKAEDMQENVKEEETSATGTNSDTSKEEENKGFFGKAKGFYKRNKTVLNILGGVVAGVGVAAVILSGNADDIVIKD